jgi:superfamily I DNA/RNA helicase
LPLTDEQRAVIQAEAPILKVNAVAGSGKTTTLLEFAAYRPRQRILYLAYNRAVAEEVRAKALELELDHIKVKTIHALAYQYAQGYSYELGSELSEWQLLDEYVPASVQDDEDALLYAWLIKDVVNYYLNSSLVQLDDDLLTAYADATMPSEPALEILVGHSSELLGVVNTILSDMKQKRIPALHDFYLKLFQFMRTKLPYDVILVDEAQDTSGVMLHIIGRQEQAQRVFVGDSFQQIYAFRHAVNSLERVEGVACHLSQTFRFGDGLARHLSQQVNEAYALLGEDRTLNMRGTEVQTRFGPDSVRSRRKPLAVIARSNLGLFEAVLDRLYRGGSKSMHFEGGYAGYNFMNARIVSLLNLKEGKLHQVEDPLIRKFSTFAQAKRFAKDTQNPTLSNLIDLVSRYGAKLYTFDRDIKARLTSKDQAQLVFTTTHKAKGQEYDMVEMVEKDFSTREDLENLLDKGPEAIHPAKLREEVNVYYVAATRARQAIQLAPF